MEQSKRKTGPARWVIILASGVATAGFWVAIVSNQQVINSSPPTTSTNKSITSAATTPNQANASRVSPGNTSQPSVALPRPRLRTRGS